MVTRGNALQIAPNHAKLMVKCMLMHAVTVEVMVTH